MRLPKFAFLTHTVGFTGVKVICLESPYIIASIIEVHKTQPEKISEYLDDMVQGRYLISKVKGYSIFLTMYAALDHFSDKAYVQEILDEMAEFVLTERVLQKPGQFRRCDETEKTITERVEERDSLPRLRPRRPRGAQ